MRPYLPPPIETVLVDGTEETPERRGIRQAYEAGYQAGLVEGRHRGHDDGHRAGLAEGLEQGLATADEAADRAQREGLSALNRALDTLLARRAEDRAALEGSLRTALSQAVRILAPALSAAAMRSELEALVAEAMARRGSESVVLRAHPDTLAEVPAGSVPASVELLADPMMRKDMATASWQIGGVVFDATALAEGVLAILAPPAADGCTGATDPSPQQEENPA